jgi:hypothetical protein
MSRSSRGQNAAAKINQSPRLDQRNRSAKFSPACTIGFFVRNRRPARTNGNGDEIFTAGLTLWKSWNNSRIMIAATFLILLGIYLACGLVFAGPFVVSGVKKIDPHAAHGSWGFRLLIIPGTLAFWPLLLRRWLKGVHEPPEERTAHRLAAQKKAAP